MARTKGNGDNDELFGSSSESEKDNDIDDGLDGSDSDDSKERSKNKSRLKKLGKSRLKKKSSSKKEKKKKKKKKRRSDDSVDDDDNLGSDFEDEEVVGEDGGSDVDHESDGGRTKTKKERIAALARRKRSRNNDDTPEKSSRRKKDRGREDRGGSDSEDSYNSVEYQNTKEDDDFIDRDGDDEDLLREYSEQKQDFRDVRATGSESEDENGRRIKKRGRHCGNARPIDDGPGLEKDANGVPLNPIMAAAHRMKRFRRTVEPLAVRENKAREFLDLMEDAAEADEEAIKNRASGKFPTAKLAMIPRVRQVLAKRDIIRPLIEHGLLSVARMWIQPLPSGKLGNVTVRKGVLECIKAISSGNAGGNDKNSSAASSSHDTDDGHSGITASDLKRSEFGRTVMTLYMHPDETPELKKLERKLIEEWSRPIFNKSENMRDLKHVQEKRNAAAREYSVGDADVEYRAHKRRTEAGSISAASASNPDFFKASTDLGKILKAQKGGSDLGSNRVRVPYSRGFQFTVRPDQRRDVMMSARDKGRADGPGGGGLMAKLRKKMLEKKPSGSKNLRSDNVSIGGKKSK